MTTDEQIRAAYQRLDAALAPPPDADRRVARRSAARRRHRRAAALGATAVVVLAVAGTAIRLAGGEESADTVATDPTSGPVSTLVMTRPDGSTVAFPDITVSCDDAAGGGPSDHRQRISAASPRRVDGKRLEVPLVYVEGILAKIQGDRTFTLPHNSSQDSDQRPMILFIADTRGTDGGNEVSSEQHGTAGTVRVVRASCDPEPVLELEVDATLGSEVEQGTLDLAGSLH